MVSRFLASARHTSTNMWVAVALVLCAVPPATNLGPGQWGYVLALLVLTLATAWGLAQGHRSTPLTRRDILPIVALGGWLLLGVARAGHDWDTALAATLLAGLAVAAPWALARSSEPAHHAETLVLVMAAAVVGSAFAAWIVPLVLTDGIHWRQGLPIGGASNSAVGLTLAMSGCLAGARKWREQRWIWRCLAAVAGLLLVQSLSRAGWVLALVLLAVVLATHRHWQIRRALPFVAVIAVGAVIELTRRRQASILVDPARWDNAMTGLHAWTESLGTVLVGVGAMRMWPWMALERGRPGDDFAAPLQYDSPWGRVLYHAHSTYLDVLVEHGVIGLVLLVAVLAVVVRRCVREIRHGGDLMLVAVALLLALPAMLVETYLLRGFPTAFLYWSAVMVVGSQRGGLEAPR